MKKTCCFPGVPVKTFYPGKRGKTGISALTGEWELAGEEGYDETDAPDGWDEKRFDASFLFAADGTGRYTGGEGGYVFRWEFDGERLSVIPAGANCRAVYEAGFPAKGIMRLESKVKSAGTPYWSYYNRATYRKKT